MSEDKYVYLKLKYENDIYDIKVPEAEYRDMLRTLRMFDEPTQYWLREVTGMMYNMNKVLWFSENEVSEFSKKLLDKHHKRYVSRRAT